MFKNVVSITYDKKSAVVNFNLIFSSQLMNGSNKLVLVNGRPFQPSLMLTGKS
jgi:hypothetical protein